MKKLILLSILLIVGCEGILVEPEDCAGVAGGMAELDNCGICDTDKTNDCVQDCAGEWGKNVELWGECYNIETTDTLNLWSSGLTGEIPVEIGSLTNLNVLHLQQNQLTGEIPLEIGNLTNLTYLFLSSNQLTGEIPSEIGNLTNLTDLWLQHNQLTGELPPEIGNLTNLTTLWLAYNRLSGDIPQQVCDLFVGSSSIFLFIFEGNNLTNTCE